MKIINAHVGLRTYMTELIAVTETLEESLLLDAYLSKKHTVWLKGEGGDVQVYSTREHCPMLKPTTFCPLIFDRVLSKEAFRNKDIRSGLWFHPKGDTLSCMIDSVVNAVIVEQEK